jgi:type I restriction enzyme S subunit
LITIKKSLLENFVPKEDNKVPKIRFKGFSSDWKNCKFTDEVTLYSGLTYSPDNIVETDGTLVLRSSNVQNGEICLGDNVYVANDFINSNNVEIGDIIVVVRNGSRALIGKHAQIKRKMANTVIGAFMTGIKYEYSGFINALLNTTKFETEIQRNMGATINQITNGAFNNMYFSFPQDAEKERIGKFFNKLDDLISLRRQKIEKLTTLKKALLNKMFI